MRRKRSAVFINGHIKKSRQEKVEKNVCVYCDQEYEISTSTKNLIDHLKNTHDIDPNKSRAENLQRQETATRATGPSASAPRENNPPASSANADLQPRNDPRPSQDLQESNNRPRVNGAPPRLR